MPATPRAATSVMTHAAKTCSRSDSHCAAANPAHAVHPVKQNNKPGLFLYCSMFSLRHSLQGFQGIEAGISLDQLRPPQSFQCHMDSDIVTRELPGGLSRSRTILASMPYHLLLGQHANYALHLQSWRAAGRQVVGFNIKPSKYDQISMLCSNC